MLFPLKGAWDEEYTASESLIIIDGIASAHADLGGVVGAEIKSLITSRDYPALVQYDLNVNKPNWDVLQLIECRQALAFYQKGDYLDIGIDKRAVALEKFWAAEAACKETNDLLRPLRLGSKHSASILPSVLKLLDTAGRKVRKVLGPCPSIEGLSLRFGPGATTVIKRKDSCPQFKFAAGFQCSSGLLASGLLPTVMRSVPHWIDALYDPCWNGAYTDVSEVAETGYAYETQRVPVDVVPGKLEFVPKNAKTFRSIMVEPSLNGLLQGGIGRHIERRLRRVGLNISDQTRNQRLAREGSVTGSLATLDLSSASDLISTELVRFLVSEDWWRLLSAARTGSCLFEGQEYQLQKMSSMGNGFSFPLETLIFWAISTSAIRLAFDESEVGVYGDDIIVPARSVHDVIWGLTVCGFSINTGKSFWDGPFRESCGQDYYMGINTRPYYQKHLVSGATLFNLHNFYYRNYNFEFAEKVLAFIPSPLRLYGPDGYGDGHLLCEEWPRAIKKKWREKGYSGYSFESFSLQGLKIVSRYPGDYVSPLYMVYVADRVPLVDSEGWEQSLNLRADLRRGLHGSVSESTPCEFLDSGRPLWTLPGTEGYKRVKIYTLAV